MRGKSCKKVDHINCKIIAFGVKKRAFFTPWSTSFESSWFKAFVLHKLEAFDIVLRNWIENPKINKNPKNLYSFLKGHQVVGGMW
jgi:hypothetical protein